jgi:hypothetical protein
VLKKGEAVLCRDMARADWRWSAANVSRRKITRGRVGLRQRVNGHGASCLARGHGRGQPVGLQGGRQSDARQVFDAESAPRARTFEGERRNTKVLAC